MTQRQIGRLTLAAVFGSLAYAVGLLGFSEIGCRVGWFVSCSLRLEALPFILLVLSAVGLVVHLVAAPLVMLLRGTTFERIAIVVALYAILGYVVPELWMLFTSESNFFAPSLLDIPPLIGGAALGLVVWYFWARGSNSTPHTDARASAVPIQSAPAARAGGRGR